MPGSASSQEKFPQRGRKARKRINAMKQETEGTESSDGVQDKSYGKVNTIHIHAVKGCAALLEAEINDVRVKILHDPGAVRSVISEQTWRKVGAPPLKPTDTLIGCIYECPSGDSWGNIGESERIWKRKNACWFLL